MVRDMPAHPQFSRATWAGIAVGVGAIGTGLSAYGANQQRQDAKGANAANQAAIAKQDQDQWNSYLLQRGLYGGGSTPYGQIPTNAQPVNSRLPLWATLTTGASQPGALVVRRKAGAPPLQRQMIPQATPTPQMVG